jgi:hypothetical protein
LQTHQHFFSFHLEFVSKKLQADREIVMTAVKSNGYSMKFASEDLKKRP